MGPNSEISSTLHFLIFSLIPVLDSLLSDSRRKHALIICLDRIISTNWLGVGELCSLRSRNSISQASIEGNTWLFNGTVVDGSNVKAWKTAKDGV